jgi:hypothetical protein
LGKEIFKNACNKIGLTDETDYFGLRFINKKDGEVRIQIRAIFEFICSDNSFILLYFSFIAVPVG